ncbi:hypothetical protein OG462_04820 [Streptomyces sp. NBC_01077]|uniref:hypothetical protein n=1 Tax=Streptomyces sp. NBC_01077 TaxID=2903746 RepID=UPI0038678B69|nr:hypothetical protein OG462_04820 [Streptomyces sp. NBC_01077]
MGSAFLPVVGRRPLRALPRAQRVDDPLQRRTLEERIALPHRDAPPAAERPGAASFRTWALPLHGGARLGGATGFRPVIMGPFADHGHNSSCGCGCVSNSPTRLARPHRRGLAPEL